VTGAFGGNRFHDDFPDGTDEFGDAFDDDLASASDDEFDGDDGWLRDASARRSRKIRIMGIAMAVALGIPLLAGAVATMQRLRTPDPPTVASIRATFVTAFDPFGCAMVNGTRWRATEPLPASADPSEPSSGFLSGTLTFSSATDATFLADTPDATPVPVQRVASADGGGTNGPAVGCAIP